MSIKKIIKEYRKDGDLHKLLFKALNENMNARGKRGISKFYQDMREECAFKSIVIND